MTSPSSLATGLASFVFSTATVHPVIGWVLTDAIGYLVGIRTSSLTVLAAFSSLGTLKLSTSKPPFGALDGVMLTWAPAGSAARATTPATSAASTTRRDFFTISTPLRSMSTVQSTGAAGKVPDDDEERSGPTELAQ